MKKLFCIFLFVSLISLYGCTKENSKENSIQSDIEQEQSVCSDFTAKIEDSIHYKDGVLSFQVPDSSGNWTIFISGRSEKEGFGGMSLHYLENQTWTPGDTYSFSPDSNCTDLIFTYFYEDSNGSCENTIDLLPYIQ